MAKNKTTETNKNVGDFLNAVKNEKQRQDSFALLQIIQEQTGLEPKMWGPSIVGFGAYHYKYESGHEGNAPLIGFSPRATAITLYLSGGFEDREVLLEQLGKHKTGKGCLYIKKLEDIDTAVLQKMIVKHIAYIKQVYPDN